MLNAQTFRVERDLKPSLFKEHPIGSEHYDFEELEELRAWGVQQAHIDELLSIAGEGGSHPYYPVLEFSPLPERMRIYIEASFTTANGEKLQGMLVNPEAFIFGLFEGSKIIHMFNPNLPEYWSKAERAVLDSLSSSNRTIFPLQYQSPFISASGEAISGYI